MLHKLQTERMKQWLGRNEQMILPVLDEVDKLVHDLALHPSTAIFRLDLNRMIEELHSSVGNVTSDTWVRAGDRGTTKCLVRDLHEACKNAYRLVIQDSEARLAAQESARSQQMQTLDSVLQSHVWPSKEPRLQVHPRRLPLML